MRTYVVFLAALMTFVPIAAKAQDRSITGTEFMSICRTAIRVLEAGNVPISSEDAVSAGRCVGIVEGVGGLYNVMAGAKWIPEKSRVCLPSTANNEQIVRVTLKYMEEHPEELGADAGALTFMALQQYFPCNQ